MAELNFATGKNQDTMIDKLSVAVSQNNIARDKRVFIKNISSSTHEVKECFAPFGYNFSNTIIGESGIPTTIVNSTSDSKITKFGLYDLKGQIDNISKPVTTGKSISAIVESHYDDGYSVCIAYYEYSTDSPNFHIAIYKTTYEDGIANIKNLYTGEETIGYKYFVPHIFRDGNKISVLCSGTGWGVAIAEWANFSFNLPTAYVESLDYITTTMDTENCNINIQGGYLIKCLTNKMVNYGYLDSSTDSYSYFKAVYDGTNDKIIFTGEGSVPVSSIEGLGTLKSSPPIYGATVLGGISANEVDDDVYYTASGTLFIKSTSHENIYKELDLPSVASKKHFVYKGEYYFIYKTVTNIYVQKVKFDKATGKATYGELHCIELLGTSVGSYYGISTYLNKPIAIGKTYEYLYFARDISEDLDKIQNLE